MANSTVTPAMRPIWSELEVELDEVELEVELGPSEQWTKCLSLTCPFFGGSTCILNEGDNYSH